MARVNTTKAVKAWMEGRHWKEKKTNAIWTSGGILYSYNTPIGKWSDVTETAILNVQRYSVTTTCQQHGVQQLLRQHGRRMLLIDNAEAFYSTDRE